LYLLARNSQRILDRNGKAVIATQFKKYQWLMRKLAQVPGLHAHCSDFIFIFVDDWSVGVTKEQHVSKLLDS
jgi:hypothetical protein